MFKAETDRDKNVFKVEAVDKAPEGFTETNEYFVDSSGFGQEGEAALTPEAFLKKVTAGKYYAITGQGQFQVYVTEYVKN